MSAAIVWWALAIGIGAGLGLAVGHMSVVVAWVRRMLEDPIVPSAAGERDAPPRDQLGRTS